MESEFIEISLSVVNIELSRCKAGL